MRRLLLGRVLQHPAAQQHAQHPCVGGFAGDGETSFGRASWLPAAPALAPALPLPWVTIGTIHSRLNHLAALTARQNPIATHPAAFRPSSLLLFPQRLSLLEFEASLLPPLAVGVHHVVAPSPYPPHGARSSTFAFQFSHAVAGFARDFARPVACGAPDSPAVSARRAVFWRSRLPLWILSVYGAVRPALLGLGGAPLYFTRHRIGFLASSSPCEVPRSSRSRCSGRSSPASCSALPFCRLRLSLFHLASPWLARTPVIRSAKTCFDPFRCAFSQRLSPSRCQRSRGLQFIRAS